MLCTLPYTYSMSLSLKGGAWARRRRSAARTRRKVSGAAAMAQSSSWWLIVNHESGRMEVLVLSLAGGEKIVLPVFSFKEEAELFFRLGASFAPGGWLARESGAGELVSLLLGPLSGVERVALDPLPGRLTETVVGLVSTDRATFIERLLMGKGEPTAP